MQKEKIDRANEILQTIREDEIAVGLLEEFSEKGGILFKIRYKDFAGVTYDDMRFEPWEIRLIIHNKKQRIAALERELEKL